jgi:hypothetical protein
MPIHHTFTFGEEKNNEMFLMIIIPGEKRTKKEKKNQK